MVRKKNKLITFLLTAICSMTATMIISSLAWFGAINSIEANGKLGGSLLQGYFQSGNGSADDPFTIATPRQYENFVRLHYNMEGFAENNYHFEFGYPFDGSTPTFYGTNENGVVDTTITNSTTLNLGGMELPPLGTTEYPFAAHINGNDLTIKNFIVTAKGYNDIGIFGYVTAEYVSDVSYDIDQALIRNCYWSDFTIDTTQATKIATPPHILDDDHPKRLHDDTFEVGYLAGHVEDAACFGDCYINNCKITGQSPMDDGNDTFGYYGKVDKDSLGGRSSKGEDYSFSLDSEAVYNYFNTNVTVNGTTQRNYDYISNQALALRNTEGAPAEGTRFNTAVTHNTDNNTYELNGCAPGESGEINYSLSTIGYTEDEVYKDVEKTYHVYYDKNGNGTKSTPEKKPVYEEQTLIGTNRGQTYYEDEDGNRHYVDRDNDYTAYYRKDPSNGWVYGESYNRYIEEDDVYTLDINLKLPTFETNRDYNDLWGIESLQPKAIQNDVQAILFLDDQQISFKDQVKFSGKESKNGWDSNTWIFTCTNLSGGDTLTLRQNIALGTHHIAVYFYVPVTNDPLLFSSQPDGMCRAFGILEGSHASLSDLDTRYLRQIDHEINNNTSYTIDLSGGNTNLLRIRGDSNYQPDTLNLNTQIERKPFIFIANHIFEDINRTKEYTIRFYEFDGTNENYLDPAAYASVINTFTKDDFKYEVDDQNNPHWTITKIIKERDDRIDRTTYVAGPIQDDERYASSPETSIWTSGYRPENIDVVGGGTSFYYRNFNLLGIEFKVLSLTPETNSSYATGTISDINYGEKFYATKYCPNSVVMYIRSYSNPADSRDDTLGNIKFTYVNISIAGFNLIDLETPVFKKGSGNSINITSLGGSSENDGFIDFTTDMTCTITESGAKKCCYCALDDQGRIVCTFDNAGNPNYGSRPLTPREKDEKIASIATYVLCLGATGTSVKNTWITNIDFTYTAQAGFGGTFGPVGYRSAGDSKITDTILNFYFDNPTNNYYSVLVSYQESNHTYTITFESTANIQVNVFNYDPDTYTVIFNGVSHNQASFNVLVGGAAPPTS